MKRSMKKPRIQMSWVVGLSSGALIVPFGDPNPRLQAKDKVDEVALCDDIERALTPSTT
jgi:hypothetical protein